MSDFGFSNRGSDDGDAQRQRRRYTAGECFTKRLAMELRAAETGQRSGTALGTSGGCTSDAINRTSDRRINPGQPAFMREEGLQSYVDGCEGRRQLCMSPLRFNISRGLRTQGLAGWLYFGRGGTRYAKQHSQLPRTKPGRSVIRAERADNSETPRTPSRLLPRRAVTWDQTPSTLEHNRAWYEVYNVHSLIQEHAAQAAPKTTTLLSSFPPPSLPRCPAKSED